MFFLFLSSAAFFSFSLRGELGEGSLVSGHVCFWTPPEGAELADCDTNRFIKSRAAAISSPRRSDRWREVVEPPGLGGGTAGLGMELADG